MKTSAVDYVRARIETETPQDFVSIGMPYLSALIHEFDDQKVFIKRLRDDREALLAALKHIEGICIYQAREFRPPNLDPEPDAAA